jgi:hypothetical protein
VLDIPAQLWSDLADLLLSANSDIAPHRRRFARVIYTALGIRGLDDIQNPDDYSLVVPAPYIIHVLRIGRNISRRALNRLASSLLAPYPWVNEIREFFLLFIRFARENDDRQFVEDLFSDDFQWRNILGVPQSATIETLDIESTSMDLTYREAMDLHWALEAARQAEYRNLKRQKRER